MRRLRRRGAATPPPARGGGRRRLRALASGLLVVAAVALGACGADAPVSGPTSSDPGPVHVHGLGVNPADGALFIATHTGLFRSGPGETTAARVTDRRQDTMGFTVAGPDHFLGSGHPDLRDDLPPFLGLIESTDAGRSWRPVSLLGKADLHILRADGDRIVGFDSRFDRLLVSADGGRHWTTRSRPEPLLDLVVSPARSSTFVASGERGLHRSDDGGRRWQRIDGRSGLLAWPEADALYLLEETGVLWLSRDGGRGWRRAGEVRGEPAALLAADARQVYAALHDGAILLSRDGGATWTLRLEPSE